MFGSAKPLIKYMDGSSTRFIIPVYQRNYDWKINNCKQLFDDLEKIIKNNRENHFFGSIVSVVNTYGDSSELLIIDGQQRITTVSLLFLALVNLLKERKIIDQQGNLAARIENTYLIDQFQPEEKKVKLKPIKDDQDAFLKLFEGAEDYNLSSNVTQNYMYFYSRILNTELTADELYRAICSLLIIDISLDPYRDDAQLIFESLNSTGLDLSEGDKIRNFILMGLVPKDQEKYYNSYWNKIEKNTSYEVSDFIRHYLTVKLTKTPAIKEVYQCFKDYAEKSRIDVEELLQNLLKNSKYYYQIKKSCTGVEKADFVLNRLNILDMNVLIPYLMGLLEYRESTNMSNDEFIESLLTLETYIFRRLICGVPTNALNKIFALLHKDCLKYKNNDDNYVEVLKYILNNKSGSGRMPKDNEFLISFEEKNIYSMQLKNKMYLFDRLENGDFVEHNDVIKLMQEGTYSIEHIMPQTLSKAWRDDLGDNYQEIYDKWINRIANLTLTGYNSHYSNKSFSEKKNAEYGFADSRLYINHMIATCDKWTEEELVKRNSALKEQALKLWKYPESSFTPEIPVNEKHTLDEDYDFKGKHIVSFSFKDTMYSAESWSDMYQQVVKMLYEAGSTIIYKLVNSDDYNFTDKENDGYARIAEKVYLYVATSTMLKINSLRRLFGYYQIDGNELMLELENGNS